MSFRYLRLAVVSLTVLTLGGFRMPVDGNGSDRLLYDVRGAFVTAHPDVSRDLITRTDLLVDTAIRATNRPVMLPRTILTVRIGEARSSELLFGHRYSATVTVKAISVSSGDPVAEGTFEETSLAFGQRGAVDALAEKIAARIASEFKLANPRRSAVVTAYAETPRP